MELIQKLSDKVENRIELAKSDIDMAMEVVNKYPEYPDIAKALATLSNNVVEDINILHAAVVKVIQDYRSNNGEPPEPMMAV